MRQSQCRVLLWRSAVVTKNLRTTVPTILITFTGFKGWSRLWEDAHKICIYGSKQMTPSISVESKSRLLLHPIAVSHYSVLIMFNNWRVCEVWKPREERGEVQTLSVLHHPIPLSMKSLAHSKIGPENRKSKQGLQRPFSLGICKLGLIKLLWDQ